MTIGFLHISIFLDLLHVSEFLSCVEDYAPEIRMIKSYTKYLPPMNDTSEMSGEMPAPTEKNRFCRLVNLLDTVLEKNQLKND